jgi:hypothetical protein
LIIEYFKQIFWSKTFEEAQIRDVMTFCKITISLSALIIGLILFEEVESNFNVLLITFEIPLVLLFDVLIINTLKERAFGGNKVMASVLFTMYNYFG